MDRLLEGEELNLLPLAEYTKQLLKAQDAKTARLVVQEIFKKLEEMIDSPNYPDSELVVWWDDIVCLKEIMTVKY